MDSGEEPVWTVTSAGVGATLGSGLLTCDRQRASNSSTARRGAVKSHGSFLQIKHFHLYRLSVPSQAESLQDRDGVLPPGRASAEGLLSLKAYLIPVTRGWKSATLT